jgi:hypothetical protein
MFLTRLFTAPERAKPAPPVPVTSRHIPFVERLWLQLRDAQGQLIAKRAYLREARDLGLKIATVASLAEQTETEAAAIERAAGELDRVKRILELGAEPTTPPRDWYCGHLAEPARVKSQRGGEEFPAETWPNREHSRSTNVFRGAMPMLALRRYAAALELIDEARVYSPHYEHFIHHPPPEMRDPVLIGMIRFLGEPQYFELARWDIDGDLAVVFGRVAR